MRFFLFHGILLTMRCPYCDEEFTPNNSRVKTCGSVECKKKQKSEREKGRARDQRRIPLNALCVACGVPFTRSGNTTQVQQYCTTQCRNNARNKARNLEKSAVSEIRVVGTPDYLKWKKGKQKPRRCEKCKNIFFPQRSIPPQVRCRSCVPSRIRVPTRPKSQKVYWLVRKCSCGWEGPMKSTQWFCTPQCFQQTTWQIAETLTGALRKINAL